MNEQVQRCIKECLGCHSLCLETLTYCLQQDGRHSEKDHIRLLIDCAEVCQTSANFMLRGSPLHPRSCGLCAEVCERCAEDCAKFGGDAQMQACADSCRRCAESCRKMARRIAGAA
jgi:hypothetical protein